MERKKYYFIALTAETVKKAKLLFESVKIEDTITVSYVSEYQNAVSFSSEEGAKKYARKYLTPFVDLFNVRIVSEWGDFSRNECLMLDIRGEKE